jgi:hypothetical protein
MPDTIAIPRMSEQAEEFDAPSEDVLAVRLIPWIPVLAFVQVLCIFFIFFSVFTL